MFNNKDNALYTNVHEGEQEGEMDNINIKYERKSLTADEKKNN